MAGVERVEEEGVEAVMSVVIQKLKDVLKEERFVSSGKVRKQLKITGEELMDAEKKDDERVKNKKAYLDALYRLEDEVETFVFWNAVRRNTPHHYGRIINTICCCSFFSSSSSSSKKHFPSFFINDLRARKLRKDMKRIGHNIIKKLNKIDSFDSTVSTLSTPFSSTGRGLSLSPPNITSINDGEEIICDSPAVKLIEGPSSSALYSRSTSFQSTTVSNSFKDEFEAGGRPHLVQRKTNNSTVSTPFRSTRRGLSFSHCITVDDGEADDDKIISVSPVVKLKGGPSSRAYSRNRSLQSTTVSTGFKDGLGGGGRPGPVQRKITISRFYFRDSSAVLGFKEDIDQLVTQLLNHHHHQQRRRIICIIGAEGSGKTTLARAIYDRRDIKQHFKHRAWIFVSNDDDEHEDTRVRLFKSILKQVARNEEEEQWGSSHHESPEQLLSKLRKSLQTESYLLVVDDIRTRNFWDDLKDAFPSEDHTNPAGSRVIIFTSRHQVIFPTDASSFEVTHHHMRPLSDHYSWELFADRAGLGLSSAAGTNNNLPDVKDRVLTICKGSPLSIVLLGGLFYSKKLSYDEWLRELAVDESHNKKLSDLLSFSYNHLPFHSKLCLLYLGLFPKQFDVSVRRLFRLWLAEGFVKRSPTQSPEDLAEEYFNDLVFRNLIQLSKVRSDGSPKKCRMPGFVYDKLVSKARDISLFHVHRGGGSGLAAPPTPSLSVGVRRIVEYGDIASYYDSGSTSSGFCNLRSYVSFNTQRKDTPAIEVGNFLGKIVETKGYGLLRVLDLEGVYKPTLSDDTLGNLILLRYLGLRWTFLDRLPDSVGNLLYLETLDLKHTNINDIPSSIWNSNHLSHLNLNDMRLDMPRDSSLPQLLTLWGLFVDEDSPIKNGLSMLRDLRELGITCHLSSSMEALATWIAGLTALQSLRVRSKDEWGRPSKLDLKPLSDLEKLSHLYLLGHLEKKLPEWHDFPPNLKVLTLSISQLEEDPMPTLGQLPSLGVLRLFANSYLGKKMVCHSGGFDKLKTLKLWMLRSLEEWDVEEGALPILKKLEIRGCKRLREFPSRLLALSSLEDLILTAMPSGFISHLKMPDSISFTDNSDWIFPPLPWEEDEPTGSG